MDEEVRDILVGEERQRLIDFVEQFDLVISDDDSLRDAVNVDRGFPFWRSYLREMFAIHKRHPAWSRNTRAPGLKTQLRLHSRRWSRRWGGGTKAQSNI